MANISILSRLINGAQRNVDLSANTLVVDIIKVGGGSGTDLTKTILDKLLLINAAADADGTFDTRYTQIADLASTATGEGASLVGIEDDGAYFTGTDVEAALQELGAAVGSGSAADISYDNSTSGLTADNVQDAIDEVEGRVQTAESDINAVENDVANLVTLSGVAVDSTSLGTFTGVTIPDSSTVKGALQSLETALEAMPDPMEYKGNWAASTNTPELEDGTGDNGDVYYVTDAGTVDFGAGNISFEQGDRVVYSGADGEWQKWDTTDQVTSVNGQTGAVDLDTDDIDEGSNQYFTDERAQDAVISQVITNGVTDKAPSEDAVFDALATKQDASAELDEAETFFAATDITGAQAETLTDGSNADSLHSHEIVKASKVAGEAFAANTLFAVRYAKAADAGFTAGRMYKAAIDASSVDNFHVIGLSRPTSLLAAADPMVVIKSGPINVPTHGFTVGQPVYLDAAGAVTGTAPSTANMAVVKLGMAIDANNIDVQIQIMGVN